ncbi:amino acid ABC transporter ATP-binding protein [Pseudomonas lundensis]|jgi:polar amino acid transport system ATP-binding protein|uniref:Amino-acid transporter subunit ATP-binding component of ABC superfamily n=1 Tax=Pseudomonas lundensis TaxID=86185 RepID=A0AAX2H9U2_9PSED|nr:amino acid ABC transporter ATP-binding protein [Pseudomonas lundensis]HCS05716.1 amino acid ABC transporter ATP-binding protein [Pseudomonas sp.]NNA14819.1 amino acid ABC transporter ATP-binding protein [Pseudomonas lundensis]NNA35735.1 amino acid ABC transporter ATP-binding protein [Pseudomonas lundensis]OZY47225.1 amino acid ABC transporter ATP-binding protein [Pseudomonas lundensis]SOB53102.1 amino-acid transporter subunit; ATP-binding component of ABC superfamily [Pseudomonas lundensis]
MQSVITASEHQSISALTARETVVHISGLNKWYGPFQVLHGIDLTVQQGERIVLCGPSGSGKSTLIRCISHLEVAEEGVIRTLGADLTKPSPARRLALREVGMVFQSFNLFPHMTVLQNCTLAPISVRGLSHQKAAEQARHYLSKVGVENQANKYPSQLSGGQQQRVAIARALCMEPKIMLFDEPTSALDPEMVNEVLDVIVKLAETGMTLLCVTHEMGFARQVADRILFLDAGRIVEDVPPERFFTAPESDRAQAFLAQIHR